MKREPIVVPLAQLPQVLVDQGRETIESYAVTLLVTTREDDAHAAPCAGTLVSFSGRAGILTARHVWEQAKQKPVLALMMNQKVLKLDTSMMDAFIPQGTHVLPGFDAKVPDIAVVYISQDTKATIESQGKAFYNIDRRVADPQIDLFSDEGYYVVTGTPLELLKREEGRVGRLLYLTDRNRTLTDADWDYDVFNMNAEASGSIPTDFKGMSGGGVWRVRIQFSDDRATYQLRDPHRDVVLVGVVFFQTEAPNRMLIAHGPRSLYENLFKANSRRADC